MENGHTGVNIEDLRVEQQSIDTLIESLLNFTPSTSTAERRRSENGVNISSPVSLNRGRGGRQKGAVTRAAAATPVSPLPVPSNTEQ